MDNHTNNLHKSPNQPINFLKSWLLPLILTLPAVGMISQFEYPLQKQVFDDLMHSSGEFSVRLMVITLYLSPLLVLAKNPEGRFHKLLKRSTAHKRILGLYAFYYTILHLIAYFVYKNFDEVIGDLSQVTYLAGWLAMLGLIPLALTSSNTMVRRLGGKKWKRLHRLVYIAAIATAIHWLFKNGEDGLAWGPVLVHFAPLFLLEVNRYWQYRR